MSGLIYALVAKNTRVLCEYALVTGNFHSLAELILQRIPNSDSQLSYVYDNYFFHYLTFNGVTYLCLAREEFSRKSAFEFLEEMRDEFEEKYDKRIDSTLLDFSPFSSNICRLLQKYAKPDSTAVLREEIDHVKKIMISNIEKVLERGDRIDNILDRTSDLSHASNAFRQQSVALRNQLWWKEKKTIVAMVFAGIVTVYLLVGMGCGFPLFSECAA